MQLLGMTTLASRSWAIAYNGFGSSLVLGMLGEYERNPHARRMTQQLLVHCDEPSQYYIAAPQHWQSRARKKLIELIEQHAPPDEANNNDDEFAYDLWDVSAFMDGNGLLDLDTPCLFPSG
jgi:hypothetical protein